MRKLNTGDGQGDGENALVVGEAGRRAAGAVRADGGGKGRGGSARLRRSAVVMGPEVAAEVVDAVVAGRAAAGLMNGAEGAEDDGRAGAARKRKAGGAQGGKAGVVVEGKAGTIRRRKTGAAGPGAAGAEEGEAGSLADAGEEGVEVLRRWIGRRRELGATVRELVFELGVRQGRPLPEVAELLEMPLAEAREEWGLLRQEMAAGAPRAEAEFTTLREQLAAGLWTVVEQTQPRAKSLDDAGRERERLLPPCPRLLALRLRALDQIAKLYGVNLERDAGAEGAEPYAAPGEIAAEVRRKVLALHGREDWEGELAGSEGGEEG